MVNAQPLAMIIDDSAETALIMQRALEANGFTVETIYHGDEASIALTTAVPDLILLDLNLLYVSGHELLEQIKANETLNDTRVLIVSANTHEFDRLQGRVDGILAKPVLYSQLRDTIAGLKLPL